MSAFVLLVIFVSSLSWSLFDMSRKRLSSSVSPAAAVVWLMLLQAPLFAGVALIEPWTHPSSSYWWPALASLTLNLLGNIWFIQAVRLAPLSLAVPVLSLTPVFSTLGGFLLLGEKTSARQALGIVIIVASTFFLGRASSRAHPSVEERSRVVKGLALMAVVAFLFAVTPVFDKICLESLPSSQHAFIQSIASAAVLASVLKVRRQPLDLKGALSNGVWLATAVGFAALALFTQLWSIREVPVGHFDALKRSFGLIAALGLGLMVFKEPLTKAKIIAVVAIGIGIFILLA